MPNTLLPLNTGVSGNFNTTAERLTAVETAVNNAQPGLLDRLNSTLLGKGDRGPVTGFVRLLNSSHKDQDLVLERRSGWGMFWTSNRNSETAQALLSLAKKEGISDHSLETYLEGKIKSGSKISSKTLSGHLAGAFKRAEEARTQSNQQTGLLHQAQPGGLQPDPGLASEVERPASDSAISGKDQSAEAEQLPYGSRASGESFFQQADNERAFTGNDDEFGRNNSLSGRPSTGQIPPDSEQIRYDSRPSVDAFFHRAHSEQFFDQQSDVPGRNSATGNRQSFGASPDRISSERITIKSTNSDDDELEIYQGHTGPSNNINRASLHAEYRLAQLRSIFLTTAEPLVSNLNSTLNRLQSSRQALQEKLEEFKENWSEKTTSIDGALKFKHDNTTRTNFEKERFVLDEEIGQLWDTLERESDGLKNLREALQEQETSASKAAQALPNTAEDKRVNDVLNSFDDAQDNLQNSIEELTGSANEFLRLVDNPGSIATNSAKTIERFNSDTEKLGGELDRELTRVEAKLASHEGWLEELKAKQELAISQGNRGDFNGVKESMEWQLTNLPESVEPDQSVSRNLWHLLNILNDVKDKAEVRLNDFQKKDGIDRGLDAANAYYQRFDRIKMSAEEAKNRYQKLRGEVIQAKDRPFPSKSPFGTTDPNGGKAGADTSTRLAQPAALTEASAVSGSTIRNGMGAFVETKWTELVSLARGGVDEFKGLANKMSADAYGQELQKVYEELFSPYTNGAGRSTTSGAKAVSLFRTINSIAENYKRLSDWQSDPDAISAVTLCQEQYRDANLDLRSLEDNLKELRGEREHKLSEARKEYETLRAAGDVDYERINAAEGEIITNENPSKEELTLQELIKSTASSVESLAAGLQDHARAQQAAQNWITRVDEIAGKYLEKARTLDGQV